MTLLKTLAVLAVVGIGAILSWAALDTAFHATGDYEFCTSCHGYEPIARAYREDTHGGNNAFGVRAACNDCHLPHDNSLHYFWVKAKHGIVDPTMALIKEPHEIDWHGNVARNLSTTLPASTVTSTCWRRQRVTVWRSGLTAVISAVRLIANASVVTKMSATTGWDTIWSRWAGNPRRNESQSTRWCLRAGRPSTCDKVNHQQNDADNKQYPRDLPRNSGNPGGPKDTGDQADNQKH